MKLSLYVIKTTLLAMAGGVLGLWLLQAVFAYLAELESVSETYRAVDAFWYVVYRLPYFFVQFVGTGVLLGAVVGLGLLANNSEIVVMRSAGISLYRIVGWAMIPAFLFVLGSLAVNEWALPKGQLLAKQIKTPNSNALILHKFWSVVPTQDGQDIFYISHADNDGRLAGVRKITVKEGDITEMLYIKDGLHESGYVWQGVNVERVQIDGGVAKTESLLVLPVALPIERSSVHLLTKDADDLSISELYAHRQLMHHQNNQSKRHELAFWQKLLSPFAILSLLLVACSFVFGSLRSQSLGLRVVMALLTGLLFSYLTDLVGFVALATSAPPLLMVLLPIAVGAGVGLFLLARKG